MTVPPRHQPLFFLLRYSRNGYICRTQLQSRNGQRQCHATHIQLNALYLSKTVLTTKQNELIPRLTRRRIITSPIVCHLNSPLIISPKLSLQRVSNAARMHINNSAPPISRYVFAWQPSICARSSTFTEPSLKPALSLLARSVI